MDVVPPCGIPAGSAMGRRPCLLYTSDAADERSSVDLGGRRIIKKKTSINIGDCHVNVQTNQRQHITKPIPRQATKVS